MSKEKIMQRIKQTMQDSAGPPVEIDPKTAPTPESAKKTPPPDARNLIFNAEEAIEMIKKLRDRAESDPSLSVQDIENMFKDVPLEDYTLEDSLSGDREQIIQEIEQIIHKDE